MKKPKKPTTIRLATLETILPFSGAAAETQTAPIENSTAIEVKIPPSTNEDIEDLFYMFVEYDDCNEFEPNLDI